MLSSEQHFCPERDGAISRSFASICSKKLELSIADMRTWRDIPEWDFLLAWLFLSLRFSQFAFPLLDSLFSFTSAHVSLCVAAASSHLQHCMDFGVESDATTRILYRFLMLRSHLTPVSSMKEKEIYFSKRAWGGGERELAASARYRERSSGEHIESAPVSHKLNVKRVLLGFFVEHRAIFTRW